MELTDDYYDEPILLQMDWFNDQVTASIWKPDAPAAVEQLQWDVDSPLAIPALGITGTATFYDIWVSSEPLPVPEPQGFWLLATAVTLALRVRRRRSGLPGNP